MKSSVTSLCIAVTLLGPTAPVVASGAAVRAAETATRVDVDAAATLELSPRRVTLEVGKTRILAAIVRDSRGGVVELPVVFYSRARQSLSVSATGRLTALRPGRHTVVAMVPGRDRKSVV